MSILKTLPIYRYNVKDSTEEHYSPTAEDFGSLFGMDTTIRYKKEGKGKEIVTSGLAAKDLAAIALICIQALDERMEVLEARL